MEIRDINDNEWDEVIENIILDNWGFSSITKEQWKQYIYKTHDKKHLRGRVIHLFPQNEIIGVCIYNDYIHEIVSLHIKKNHQSKTYGSCLLHSVLPLHPIWIVKVLSMNTRAIKFYKSHSFFINEGMNDTDCTVGGISFNMIMMVSDQNMEQRQEMEYR